MIRLDRFDKKSVNYSTNRTVSGYKDSILGIIPDDWEVRKLKEVSKRVQRRNDCKPYEVLTISSIGGFLNQTERFSKVIAGKNIAKYILLKKNEFAYNKGNSKTYPFGCIFRLEDYEKALVPNVYYCFEIVNGISEFYKHYFIAGKLNRQLSRVINTGVRNDGLLNLNVGDFFDAYVPAPPLEEQKKIATILSNWDKAIELKERLIELKKEQKKGLMQKLLTGEVRIPGFKGEWKEVQIKDMSKVVTGNTPSTKNNDFYENGIYPWITPSDINDSKYISQSERRLTEKGLDKGRFLPKGTLLVTCIASIGKNAILTRDGSCNQQINAILPSDLHSNEFLYYKLELEVKKMERLAGKTATPIINKNTFEKYKLLIPTLDEQNAIAELLSKFDKSIELSIKELEQLKLQKKGLMQLLLTGKVRVKV